MKLKAIILDDEFDAVENLNFLLNRYCQEIEVVASFTSATAALTRAPELDFDLLFLDIEMPVLSGFDFLDRYEEIDFQVIFITSYNQYAIRAFRYSALDYLLKPIDIEELKVSVNKAVDRHEHHVPLKPHLEQMSRLNNGQDVNKMALPLNNGYDFIDIGSVVLIEADGRYSKVYRVESETVLVSIHLKEFEEMLESNGFFRLHNAFLINLKHLESYSRADGGSVNMINGMTIPVSRRKKPIFERILKSRVPGGR